MFQEHPATDSLPLTLAQIYAKCSCSLMTTGDMDNINWKKKSPFKLANSIAVSLQIKNVTFYFACSTWS